MSFYTSLSGLKASQTEMSTISHNLANVGTNGFKRSRTEFADVIASNLSTSPNQMVGSGTVVQAIRQQFTQGGLIQSGSSLDLAISGEGFFAVKTDPDSAQVNFTRNGGFLVDADRYVVDSNGGNLQVYPVDGSGTVVASGIDSVVSLRLPQTSGTPKGTSAVSLSVNLSANAAIPANAEKWTAANPYAFDRFDPTTYNQSTQTTIYDPSGNPLTMTQYFVRDTASTSTTDSSSWKVYSFVGDQQLGTDPADPQPLTLTFDNVGTMTGPTAPVVFAPFTAAGSTTEQVVSLDLTRGTTQLATAFQVKNREQDGKAVGQLDGVTVDSAGIVRASFSNGDTQALGKVALANFSNPSGLRQLGNSYWATTGLSGEVKMGEANDSGFGNLMAGTIERSNVDITEELVGLIAAQRNFQANAKALDTASQVSQTIFNIQ